MVIKSPLWPQVIGMIGTPVQNKLEAALLSCMSQSSASPSVQTAAIRAFRKMWSPQVSIEIRPIRRQSASLLQHAVMMTGQLLRGGQWAPLLDTAHGTANSMGVN